MFYLVKTFIPLLDRHFVPLDPKLYGWIDLDGYLLPQKCLNPLPQSVTVTCKCKGVCKSCGCQRSARNCTVYCDCNKNVCTNCKELSLDQKEKCVLLVTRTPLNISSRFCRPHLFYSVFKTKKSFSQKLGDNNRKNERFNELLQDFKAKKWTFMSATAETEGKYCLDVLCNALWYISHDHQTIAARCKQGVIPLARVYERYEGYNDLKRKKQK